MTQATGAADSNNGIWEQEKQDWTLFVCLVTEWSPLPGLAADPACPLTSFLVNHQDITGIAESPWYPAYGGLLRPARH